MINEFAVYDCIVGVWLFFDDEIISAKDIINLLQRIPTNNQITKVNMGVFDSYCYTPVVELFFKYIPEPTTNPKTIEKIVRNSNILFFDLFFYLYLTFLSI